MSVTRRRAVGVLATAGVLGPLALWLTGRWQIRNRWAHVAVWGLVLMYVVAAIAAIIRS